ncbi:MAG: hypothetical protein ACLTXP_16475 [Odoribacter splanchnicus]
MGKLYLLPNVLGETEFAAVLPLKVTDTQKSFGFCNGNLKIPVGWRKNRQGY